MRQEFSTGQELVNQDLNSLQSRLERGIYDRIVYELMGRKTNGFFQDGFSVTRLSATSLLVKAGLGFMVADTGTKQPVKKPLVLDADVSVNIDTPDSGNGRLDIICVKYNRFNTESENRKYKDEFSDEITTQATTVATDWKADVLYIAGTPSGSPIAPATPVGYLLISTIIVNASLGIPASGGLTDERSLLPTANSLSETGSSEYNAIVGSIGIDQGANYSDLKSALDNAQDGWSILVLRSEEVDTVPVVLSDNIEITFKRGVTMSKGTAVAGLQIDGNDCLVKNARFLDFDTGGDYGIIISNGALRTYIDAPRFNNCDNNINDQGTESYINVEYVE